IDNVARVVVWRNRQQAIKQSDNVFQIRFIVILQWMIYFSLASESYVSNLSVILKYRVFE
ncbi:hypothetical protein BTI41_09065, partial [Lactobacillus delbrueckii subsp. bulgaricus]|nr:hypothetical protein [Lactobacillus delbrueckii subsp. bulgaricus]